MATKPKNPVSTFPKTLGAAIDLYYTLRAQRLDREKEVAAMQATESALGEHIMANFAAADVDGAKGKIATASISRSTQAEIEDWTKYLTWCAKKDPAGVQKRVGITALREHWDNGEKIPGVKPITVEKLSVTKAGA
jgi:hypothetical protein